MECGDTASEGRVGVIVSGNVIGVVAGVGFVHCVCFVAGVGFVIGVADFAGVGETGIVDSVFFFIRIIQ